MSSVELLGQAPVASDRLARPLSPATRAGDFVFVSGQVPTDDQGQVIAGGIEAQTRQVFKRIEAALALAGCTLADVCKASVWLHDARDFGSFNRVYMECFGDHRPARSTVEARLMIDAKVEIDVTAYTPRG
jgi:reactive intermediate/imine deaminase